MQSHEEVEKYLREYFQSLGEGHDGALNRNLIHHLIAKNHAGVYSRENILAAVESAQSGKEVFFPSGEN